MTNLLLVDKPQSDRQRSGQDERRLRHLLVLRLLLELPLLLVLAVVVFVLAIGDVHDLLLLLVVVVVLPDDHLREGRQSHSR